MPEEYPTVAMALRKSFPSIPSTTIKNVTMNYYFFVPVKGGSAPTVSLDNGYHSDSVTFLPDLSVDRRRLDKGKAEASFRPCTLRDDALACLVCTSDTFLSY